jgi:hypothetical protein
LGATLLTTGDGVNKDYFYELLDRAKLFTQWAFHGDILPTRDYLLYQWVKYVEKQSVSIIFHDSIQNWGDFVADHGESGALGRPQFKGAADVFPNE